MIPSLWRSVLLPGFKHIFFLNSARPTCWHIRSETDPRRRFLLARKRWNLLSSLGDILRREITRRVGNEPTRENSRCKQRRTSYTSFSLSLSLFLAFRARTRWFTWAQSAKNLSHGRPCPRRNKSARGVVRVSRQSGVNWRRGPRPPRSHTPQKFIPSL